MYYKVHEMIIIIAKHMIALFTRLRLRLKTDGGITTPVSSLREMGLAA